MVDDGSMDIASRDVRYRLLGPVAATTSSGSLPLGGPKQRTVLATLLLRAGHVVPEKRLVATVWGEAPPSTVRGQLQTYVWNLRKLLGARTIVRQPPGYMINIGLGELDVDVFTRAVQEGGRSLAAGRPDSAVVTLRSALALWDGAALGGATKALIQYEGPALDEQLLAAYEQIFDAELSLGRHVQVIAELRRLIEEYPYRERLTGQLMRALHRSGRTVDALSVYAAIRARLALEFDIAPSPHLQELYGRLRGRDSLTSAVESPVSAGVA